MKLMPNGDNKRTKQYAVIEQWDRDHEYDANGQTQHPISLTLSYPERELGGSNPTIQSLKAF